MSALSLDQFLEMIEDFGNMSGGQFRRKYSDHDPYEGYGYIQRKARSFAKARAAHGETL